MIFSFALNTSSTVQSFFTGAGNPVTIEPCQALETTTIHGDTSGILEPIDSFLEVMRKKKIKRFYLHRTFALGDILMLVPVVRALRCWGYNPYLRTGGWAKTILNLLDIRSDVVESYHHPAKGEYGVMLDGVIEQDHFRPKLSEFHRVDIYFKALGAKKIPKKLDWSMDMERLPAPEVGRGDYVVFQGGGSTQKKQLPLGSISFIKERFAEKGITVVMIGEKNKVTTPELFALIAGAKGLISMDSSPLWISHFTRTPVVALLGPTRASERLTRHPLYPERAVGIALNKTMGCTSCFEMAKGCGNRMDCLKVSPEVIWNLISPEVAKWL